MNVHVILIDATKHRQGYSVQRLNGAAHIFLSKFLNRTVEWFAPEWVARDLTGEQIHVTPVTGVGVWPTILQRIEFHRSAHAPGTLKIVVMSYDPTILAAAYQAGLGRNDILPMRLAAVFEQRTQRGQWESEPAAEAQISPATLQQVWELARKTLEKGGYTAPNQALLQSALKPRMLELSAALGIPADLAMPGLIPAMVRYAVSNGQLGQAKVKGNTGHEALWLKLPSPAKDEEVPVVPRPDAKVDIPSNEQSPTAPGSLEPKLKTAPTYTRCNQMIKCLEKRSMYCQKRVRDIFLASLEEIVAENKHLTLARIAQEMINRAEKVGQEKSLGMDHRQWEVAAARMIKLLLSAQVLLDSQERPILRTDPAAMATPVYTVSEGFQDTVEAYLVLCLVRDMRDVTERDHRAIAHALLRQFDRTVPLIDMQERVATLFALLKNQITVDEDGRYAVTDSRPSVISLRAAQSA